MYHKHNKQTSFSVCDATLQDTKFMSSEQVNFFKKTFGKFQENRENEIFCDVTLKVESKMYPVHKVILSSVSEYFDKLFTTDMKERNQDVIELKEVTSETLKTCLHYIYHGEADLSYVKMDDILHATSLFQLWELKKICFDHMSKHLDVTNCIDFYLFSQKYDNKELESTVSKFVEQHAEQVIHSEAMLNNLNFQNFEIFLKAEILAIVDESLLFEALVNWVSCVENRHQKFCNLFKLIKLPRMSKDYIVNTVMQHVLVGQCLTCLKYASSSLHYKFSKNKDCLSDKQCTKRNVLSYNKEKQKKSKIIVVSEKDHTYLIKRLCQNCGEVDDIKEAKAPISTGLSSIFVHNHTIYILGCHFDKRTYSMRCRHDGKWKKLSQMKYIHSCSDKNGPSIIENKNKLFVVGGECDFFQTSNKVEYLDTTTSCWTALPDLDKPRCNTAAIFHGSFLYVIGGYSNVTLNSVERYDFITCAWKPVCETLIPRQKHAAASFGGRIFVVGGSNNNSYLTSTETYCEKSNVWTEVAQLNMARVNLGTCVVKDELFVVGGSTGFCNFNEIPSTYETWDDDAECWKTSSLIENYGPSKAFPTY